MDIGALLVYVGVFAALVGLVGRLIAWQTSSAELKAGSLRVMVTGALMALAGWLLTTFRS